MRNNIPGRKPRGNKIPIKEGLYYDKRNFYGSIFLWAYCGGLHVFDASLWENFLTILNEYIHAAFPPNYKVDFYDSTPRFCIAFVPNRELTAEELNRLVKLLCLKFSQYLQLYGLCWRMFGEYHVLDGTIHIFLYYAEFSADCQPFFKRYRIAVKHKSNASHGVLHDEALDKELNHVQNKP